jgi:hypothetical protein
MADYELVLDSTVQEGYNPETEAWGKQYKETFEFDSLGNNTLYMRYKWSDEDGEWKNRERQVFTYNVAGLRTRYEKSFWNDEEGYWHGESNTHYAYDENGNQIQYLSFEWDDENREWKNRVNVLKEYDANGNIVMENTRYWNGDTEEWEGVFPLSRRSDHLFDENNNETQTILYQWDTIAVAWVHDLKDEFEYDANGAETVYSSFTWDTDAEDWAKRFRQEKTYDSLGNLLLYMRYGPDSLGNWLHSQKTEYTYAYFEDTALVTLFERLNWEPDSSRWKCVTREVTEVDGNGKSLNRAYFDYMVDGDSLRLYQRFEWGYDQWGNMNSEVRSRGFSGSGELQPKMKEECGFDPGGNLTMRSLFLWDDALNAWVGRNMGTYSYNGDTETTISYEWDEVHSGWVETEKEIKTEQPDVYFQYLYFRKENPSDDWQGEYRYEAIFDEHANRTGDLEYAWDTISNEWYIYYKAEYEFDYAYTLNQILLPNKYSYMINYYSNKIESNSEYEWDTIANELTLTSLTTYYYSALQGESSVRASSEINVKVYPNPATGYITVGINSPTLFFEVFDLSGERLIGTNMAGTNRIDISALQPGLYVYKVQTDNKTVKGKFIVKH